MTGPIDSPLQLARKANKKAGLPVLRTIYVPNLVLAILTFRPYSTVSAFNIVRYTTRLTCLLRKYCCVNQRRVEQPPQKMSMSK
ncbi:hypothetical protein MEZE111188_21620 [Mesobacillus zeae]